MRPVRHPRFVPPCALGLLLAIISTASLPAADLTPERARVELALPLESAGLAPGAYLVSGTLTAEGAPLGKFTRIPRLRWPCPRPPCTAAVQAEIPFAGVSEALLRAFLDDRLTVRAEASFKDTNGDGERRAVLPLPLSPASMGLDAEALEELARVESASLNAPKGAITLDFRFFNPFPFAARLTRMELTVRPGTRNAYPLVESPDLALPPGETVHAVTLGMKAEDLLIIASRKVVTEQYDLTVQAQVEGTLTVGIAGRTVDLPLGK